MHLGTVEMVTQNTLTVHIASFTEQPFLLHVCHRNSDLCLALMLGFNATFYVKSATTVETPRYYCYYIHFFQDNLVSPHQKGKPYWILLEQEIMGWQWHQPNHMKSFAPCSRQITMPVPNHSVFYRPYALPAAQPTVSKHCKAMEKQLRCKGKGKGFPYSTQRVGLGADHGVQAVSHPAVGCHYFLPGL